MPEWTKVLIADPTEWLLEKKNPSVCYLTLTNILGRKKTDPEVQRAKAEIMSVGVVPRILSKNTGDGWSSPGRFYRDK